MEDLGQERGVEGRLMNRAGIHFKDLGIRLIATLAICLPMAWLAGCSTAPQSRQEQDQQLREQAAKTTQDVKAGAKVAAANAKVAAANAERKLGDIASGVREGLHGDNAATDDSGKPSAMHQRVDLNSASAAAIAALPGISGSKAQDIVDGRPYTRPRDLVKKGLLTAQQYQRIANQVVAD
jgi:DNA uptake protein ComE-like DNA-binding protein